VNPETLLRPGNMTAAHGELACEACHRRPPNEVKSARECPACHAKDVHRRHYGRQYDHCHSSVTSKGAHVQ
jgi:Zn finger protein HypA/HybF involved in hydrogenase expression